MKEKKEKKGKEDEAFGKGNRVLPNKDMNMLPRIII